MNIKHKVILWFILFVVLLASIQLLKNPKHNNLFDVAINYFKFYYLSEYIYPQASWDIVDCNYNGEKEKMTRAGCEIYQNPLEEQKRLIQEKEFVSNARKIIANTKCKVQTELPEEKLFTRYTVKPGDTFSGIALNIYGDAKYANLLKYSNVDEYPDIRWKNIIKPGWTIRIPLQEFKEFKTRPGGFYGVLIDNVPAELTGFSNQTAYYFWAGNDVDLSNMLWVYDSTFREYRQGAGHFEPGDCIFVIWDEGLRAPTLIKYIE